MNQPNSKNRVKQSAEQLNHVIVDAIQDVKGKDIVLMDLREVGGSADFYIICHGDSHTQVRAIANRVEKNVAEQLDMPALHREGKSNANWALVDYFNTVVHVFCKRELRDFYNLEALWSDAKFTEFENL